MIEDTPAQYKLQEYAEKTLAAKSWTAEVAERASVRGRHLSAVAE